MNRLAIAAPLLTATLCWMTFSQAATLTVGECSGATHANFQAAYSQLGSQSGPHTIVLCPGTHSTPPVTASWGHANVTIESRSGVAGGTQLVAAGGTLMNLTYHGLTLADVSIVGTINSSTSAISMDNVSFAGNILASGYSPVSIRNSTFDGNIATSGSLTSNDSDLTGSFTATNGPMNISGGVIEGDFGTDGNGQPINLDNVTMTAGSLATGTNTITISNSQLGSTSQSVAVTSANNVTVYDSTIWGDISANPGWNALFLDPDTGVYGTCTPDPIGGGFCGPASGNCSTFIGSATINEARRSGGGEDAFIEVRLLSGSIPASEYEGWTLSYCSDRTGNCHSVTLGSPNIESGGYPWLILPEDGLIDRRDTSFGTPGGGMDIRLDDADGKAIDYLSVAGYSSSLAVTCPFQYDTTMNSTNSFTIMRLPDGTGDWMDNGPGNSGGDPTPGDSNDGSDPGFGYDHIRLTHPASALTCSPAAVTVEACADADCSAYHPDPVEVSFTSPAVTWSPNSVVFTGSANVSLQYTTPDLVTLDAAAVDPSASNATRCFSSGVETSCEMEFLESGFVIDVPNHVSAMTVTGSIAAVKADPLNPVQCVPGFDNETKNVGFWFNYGNPSTGTLPTSINGNPVGTTSPGTALPINFDSNGVGSFSLEYPDVGEVALNARYQGSGDEAGLIMLGDDRFVARPDGFQLDIPDNPDHPPATDHTGTVFKKAGELFEINVAAININGSVTPNFGNETQPETVALETGLVAPPESEGVDPGLSPTTFESYGTDCSGGTSAPGTSCGLFAWNEVGIISITPRLASGAYLGTNDVVGNELAPVGRFIPDHFELVGGSIEDRAALDECSSGFTYFGERFDALFTLYARNASDPPTTTANYEGQFAFLGAGDLDLAGSPIDLRNSNALINWVMGAGTVNAQLDVDRSTPDGPYPNFELTTSPVDADGVALSGPNVIGATELRFGRIVIDNAIGSELGPLALPWRAEYWDGSTWLTNGDDNCTALDPAGDLQLDSSGGDTGDGTATVSLGEPGGGTTSVDETESELTLASGLGSIHFTTPGTPGWVNVLLGLDTNWPFLRDDLEAPFDVYEDNPQARATFGLFDGNSQRIHVREVTPQ